MAHQKKFNNYIDNVLSHLDRFYGGFGKGKSFKFHKNIGGMNFDGVGGLNYNSNAAEVIPEVIPVVPEVFPGGESYVAGSDSDDP
jgi:hypothetical protein